MVFTQIIIVDIVLNRYFFVKCKILAYEFPIMIVN
jgi:hypothetical protein